MVVGGSANIGFQLEQLDLRICIATEGDPPLGRNRAFSLGFREECRCKSPCNFPVTDDKPTTAEKSRDLRWWGYGDSTECLFQLYSR